jgi:hypothetical protein
MPGLFCYIHLYGMMTVCLWLELIMADEQKSYFQISAQSFSLNYDQKSKVLTLTGVEAISGRQLVAVFEPQATRGLYDLLMHTAQLLGAPLGAEEIEPPQLQ